jgi:hypothetical protein
MEGTGGFSGKRININRCYVLVDPHGGRIDPGMALGYTITSKVD